MWMVVQTDRYYPSVLIFNNYNEAKKTYENICKKEDFYEQEDCNVYLTEIETYRINYHQDVSWTYDRNEEG